MAANVESMFFVRETPWHGLGTRVMEAPTSKEALRLAGLDWKVIQEPILTTRNEIIPGFKANIRDKDHRVLGVVTDRYKIIQNDEAFAFTDALLGAGVRYETAGSLQNGRRVWLLAHMPREYIIMGEHISPYLLFSNTHDGSGGSWSMIHTGDVNAKMEEAYDTLFTADKYMAELGKEFERLRNIELTDSQVKEYIEALLPLDEESTTIQVKNIKRLRLDLSDRYYKAPDLIDLGRNAYRFVNAVSDFATHAAPLRRTANYKENLFARTMDGNPLIDRAYQLVCAA